MVVTGNKVVLRPPVGTRAGGGMNVPKIKCTCEIEYLFISDTEFDSFHDKIDTEKLYMNMRSILRCPACERLWIFWDEFDSEPHEYIIATKKEVNNK